MVRYHQVGQKHYKNITYMINSNLPEVYQNRYLSYIASNYENKWHILTQGNIIYPVLGINTLRELFGIEISDDALPPKRVKQNSFQPHTDINGVTITIDQLKTIAYQYNLTGMKAYVDLLVGYNVCCYNNYLSESLVILGDDMYNAVQLHKEFCESVRNYCIGHINGLAPESKIDVDIIANPQNGICYKDLMDFIHYGGAKPEILFRCSMNGIFLRAKIRVQDFEIHFTETSYNIEIDNIIFD